MSFGNLAVNASFSDGWRATTSKGRRLLKIIPEKPKFFWRVTRLLFFFFLSFGGPRYGIVIF